MHLKESNLHTPLVLILSTLCVVVSPVVSIAIALFYTLTSRGKRSISRLTPLSIALASFLSFINTKKVPESDLLAYYDIFVDVSNSSLSDISEFGRDPAYYAINWIAANVFWIPWSGFVFIFSFIIYYCIFTAIQRISVSLKVDGYSCASIIIIIAFFPQLFSISAHIVRQSIAGSLAVLAIVSYVSGRKFGFYGVIFSSMFHVTSLIFAPIFLQDSFNRIAGNSNPLMTIIYLIFIFCSFIFLIFTYANFITSYSVSTISYGIERVIYSNFFDMNGMSNSVKIYLWSVLGLSLFVTLFRWEADTTIHDQRARVLSAFSTILVCFCLVMSFFGLNELAGRFTFFSYALLGPILIMLVSYIRFFRFFLFCLSLTMPILFAFSLSSSPWVYKDLFEVLFFPLF